MLQTLDEKDVELAKREAVIREQASTLFRNLSYIDYDFRSRAAAEEYRADLAEHNATSARLSGVASAAGALAQGFFGAATSGN